MLKRTTLTIVILFSLFLFILGSCDKDDDTPTNSTPSYPMKTWEKIVGGDMWDCANGIIQASDGSYMIAGSTSSYGLSASDYYVVKIDVDSNIIWENTYGTDEIENGYSITETNDGGFVVAGISGIKGSGDYSAYLVKFNNNGDTIWTRSHGGAADDAASCVCATSDGGVVFTGYTESFGAGNKDIYLVKLNQNGDTSWTKTFGSEYSDAGGCVAQTSDGGYIVTGRYHTASNTSDAFLLKTDSLGNEQWIKHYSKSTSDAGFCVKETSNGGYIIAGVTGDGFSFSDIFIIKTNSYGNVEWANSYGRDESDAGYSVVQYNDGGYIVAGGTGYKYAYLVKVNTLGDTLWTRTYGSYNNPIYAYSLTNTLDGGYIFIGSKLPGMDNSDIYIYKVDSEGKLQED